MTWGF